MVRKVSNYTPRSIHNVHQTLTPRTVTLEHPKHPNTVILEGVSCYPCSFVPPGTNEPYTSTFTTCLISRGDYSMLTDPTGSKR